MDSCSSDRAVLREPEAAGQDPVLAERERCATICMDLYAMVRDGAGCCEVKPGVRLDQAARLIREGEPPCGWYAMTTQVPEPPQAVSGCSHAARSDGAKE